MAYDTPSLFESLEADQTQQRTASRRALTLADTRIANSMGQFLRGARNTAEFAERLGLVEEDFNWLVKTAAEEVGYDHPEKLAQAITASYEAALKTACDCGCDDGNCKCPPNCKSCDCHKTSAKVEFVDTPAEEDEDEEEETAQPFGKQANDFLDPSTTGQPSIAPQVTESMGAGAQPIPVNPATMQNAQAGTPTQGIPGQDPNAMMPQPQPQQPGQLQGLASWKVVADGHWIEKAIKHPGALHKELGVPEGEKIPEGKLEEATHSDNPKERERANLAETLKGMHSGASGFRGLDNPMGNPRTDAPLNDMSHNPSAMQNEETQPPQPYGQYGMGPTHDIDVPENWQSPVPLTGNPYEDVRAQPQQPSNPVQYPGGTFSALAETLKGMHHGAMSDQCPHCGGQMDHSQYDTVPGDLGGQCTSCGYDSDFDQNPQRFQQNYGQPEYDRLQGIHGAVTALDPFIDANSLQAMASFLQQQGIQAGDPHTILSAINQMPGGVRAFLENNGLMQQRTASWRVISESGNTDLGGPEPKIDKDHQTDSNPKKDVLGDEDKGRWPTKRKDITEPIKRENREVGGHPNHELKEIGEKTTESEDLPSSENAGFDTGGVDKAPHTKTWHGDSGQADPVTKEKQ